MYPWVSIVGVVAIALLWGYRLYFNGDRKEVVEAVFDSKTSDTKTEDVDPFKIEPLEDFNWETTPPLKLRPFKPKYHLTMGLSNTPLSSLLEIDNTYLNRIALRKQIIKDHHTTVIQSPPLILPALHELYIFLTSFYLPTRYPSLFTLHPTYLLNKLTSTQIPLIPPTNAFQVLGENIDEDFLILVKSEDGDGYILGGYVACFPSGFDTREKFGKKIRDIHGPVPGYKEKLERSMDRFFERVEVGKCVGRANWSVSTHERLFSPSGNHLYEGEEAKEEEINIDNTWLRCERQLLHRLPKTKALVFSFHTYMYPIRDIKEEGLGEEFATAIEGLKQGNVPEMEFYKRGVVWGEVVKSFLRS